MLKTTSMMQNGQLTIFTEEIEEDITIDKNIVCVTELQKKRLTLPYVRRPARFIRGSYNKQTIVKDTTILRLLANGCKVVTDETVYWARSYSATFVLDKAKKNGFIKVTNENINQPGAIYAEQHIIQVYERRRRKRDLPSIKWIS
jgi:hypothetical protein